MLTKEQNELVALLDNLATKETNTTVFSSIASLIRELSARVGEWRWVPENLAGQKFDSAYLAHVYLRDEIKSLRAELKAERERGARLEWGARIAEWRKGGG